MRILSTPPTPTPIFESSKIAIVINNAVVTDKLGPRLHYHITGAPLKAYILKKNKWSTITYDKVNWITLAQYLKTVPTNLLKLQHGWQQTGSQNKLMYGSNSDDNNNGLCCLGCGKEEIKFHYMTCVHQPGYKQVVRETNSLEKYLTTRNTHPDIKAILILSIRSFLTGTNPTPKWTTTDPSIQETIRRAFEDQCEIGWTNFFIRRISSQWKLAQELKDGLMKFLPMESSSLDTKHCKSGQQTCATNLCKGVMFFALNRWQIRNNTFHDKQTKREYTKGHEHLISEVTKRYFENKPNHPAINRFMGNPLYDIITGTDSTMATWRTSLYDLILKYLSPNLISSHLI